MLKVILLKGLPGSGKTTWAKELIDANKNQYKRINKDELRKMMDNSNWSKASETFILQIRDAIILSALIEGKHIIIDDTNLVLKHEERIKELIKGVATLEIKDFTDVPIETCIERDLKRLDSVGEKVIRKMYNQFLKPKTVTAEQDPTLEKIVICDLDGTLCDTNHRSPYDASTCDKDSLNEVVASIIKDKKVILVSGREDKYRPQTEKFLIKHKIKHLDLFMRKTGDFRNDTIIKQEIFDEHIKGKYCVEYCLDDRERVVKFWRSIGLTCLQVAEGDF